MVDPQVSQSRGRLIIAASSSESQHADILVWEVVDSVDLCSFVVRVLIRLLSSDQMLAFTSLATLLLFGLCLRVVLEQ